MDVLRGVDSVDIVHLFDMVYVGKCRSLVSVLALEA